MAKQILVIDDEEDMVNLLKSRLEANEYEVVTATDGQEGLNKVKDQKPDLIILDVMMPNMDGFSFVLELKGIEGGLPIPIIVLTAKDKLQEIFKLEGVEDYLIKPFESDELIKKIKEKVGE